MMLSHFLSQIYPTAWQLGLGLLLVVIALFARNGIIGVGERIWPRVASRFHRIAGWLRNILGRIFTRLGWRSRRMRSGTMP
jgi:hypothetical protein